MPNIGKPRAVAVLFIVSILFAGIFLFAFESGAFDLVVFNDDTFYLNSKHYLEARHYEVNKIIDIDNTRENLILAPCSLKYDKKYNRLLVGDYLSGKIKKYSLNTYKYSGDFETGFRDKKIVGCPADIFIMPDFKRYLIADTFFNRISFLDSKGFLVNVTGKTGEAAGEFSEPAAVTSAAGLIFVADKYNCRICVYDIKGVFKYAFSSKGSGEAQLYLPSALRAVGTDEVYICDSGNDRIQVFSFKGKHIKSIGRRGRSKGFFNAPSDICFDSNSNFYVADSYNRRIQKFTFDGRFICEINRLESSFLSSDYKPDFYYKMPRNYDSNEINFSLGELIMPLKIDVDNDTSFLYVLDSIHKKIYVLDCDNFNKGRELYFARNFKDAIKYLSIAADENPRNLNALYYLGYCNQQIFDYKKAYECYKKIINYHSAGEVEKHAKYQLKKIAAMNSPDYFSKVEEKENIDKKREEIKQTYVKFFGSTDEITAFDRMREMYFKEYEIKIPSKYDLHYEKKEYNLDDDEYYEEWK